MIYLVSNQKQLFDSDLYQTLSLEDALSILNTWDIIQFDTETSGRNPHVCNILCSQFGNKKADIQIVVDNTTIDITKFKNILENKLIVGHNLKFDIQFLYNYGIIPTKVWDTMIIEQLLHLGFDNKFFHYSLKAVAERRLNIDIDKTTRGEIIWRGLDSKVIQYAAGDVMYLEDIMEQQIEQGKLQTCNKAIEIENAFVPVIAYLEWCGIRLDVDKWKLKIQDNEAQRDKALEQLNQWAVNYYKTKINKPVDWIYINQQGDLFSGWDLEPKCAINWASSKQVIPFVQMLGFNTKAKDKQTGQIKDSIVEKVLCKQKGIADDFLKLYFKYKEKFKDCSTYGYNYIDAINPNTERIHTTFWQLGASSGRMSCGSQNSDTDLAKLKGINSSRCKSVQLQNLPSDEITRSAFIPNEGNLFTSCDYSALESRLGADIYNEPEMLKEFLEGSGDIHSLCAKLVFKNELKDVDIKDIKHVRPDLRKKVKPIEFSQQFGGGPGAVADALGCSKEEAISFVKAYSEGFKGISKFKALGSKFVRDHGFIIICKHTGHKVFWEDWEKWKKIEDMDDNTYQYTLSPEEKREHTSAAAKWDRLALNAPTQGTGIIILKCAMIAFFKWLVKNNYFNVVLLCNLVHDEACIEYPKELKDIIEPKLVEAMEKAAAVLCKKLPIPAEPSTGTHWIH